jgi:hypothetical protein
MKTKIKNWLQENGKAIAWYVVLVVVGTALNVILSIKIGFGCVLPVTGLVALGAVQISRRL